MTVIQLECQCNDYPWGKVGSDSLAAQYASAAPGRNFQIDASKPYAEMWMGTYPTTPSKILSTGEDLQQHIDNHIDELVGKSVFARFGSDLPFLPKILSIAKALPLQIHPDKQLADRLHDEQPDKFGDTNHKPEIAVALGPFESFVGWMPLAEIQQLWTSIPALAQFVNKRENFTNDALRNLVRRMLSAPDQEIVDLFIALKAQQYDKSDPAILIALLTMNYLELQKGDTIYIPADGIHAYLSGDIIECMARSDNVLNTGFCPRADRDSVDVFTAALTFSPMGKEEARLKTKPSQKSSGGQTRVFSPPLSEFEMLATSIKAGESERIKPLDGPGIMVVTSGSGSMRSGGKTFDLKEGYVFFIGYASELELVGEKGLETYIAYCEVE